MTLNAPANTDESSALAMAFDTYMAECRARVNRSMALQLERSCGDETLLQAIRYATLGGGKRIRPLLVYAAAEAMGVKPEQVDSMACAVEFIHSYSLVHDDLPAMDDDDLRRGQPTVHRAYDEATAILVGDALQSLAFEVLADTSELGPSAEARLQMVTVLGNAAGLSGMVGGQAVDFHAVGKRLRIGELERMHNLKTGALIVASVELGALAQPSVDALQLQNLRSYGHNLGLAFQVTDDILDVTADTDTLGKPQGSDESLNKPTYVSLLGLEDARSKAQILARRAISDLEDFSTEADRLRELALYAIKRVN